MNTTELHPGDMLLPPPPGEIGIPGVVVVNAVYNSLPMSEVTDKFNTLRDYKTLHAKTGGGRGIKVGVADTGVDKKHLSGDLLNCVAKDFTRSRTGFYDVLSHGTHTTGHIGARGDGVGFIGLAPNCDLYHAKVLGDRGTGDSKGIAAGIDWMVEQGCQLINLSLGGSFSTDIELACRNASNAGVLVFASMGNSGSSGGGHPGTSRYTFGITALDYNKRVAGFSSKDRMAKFAGYGVQILSLITGGKLGRMSGTSMSCPDQVGLAANILSYMKALQLPLPTTMEQYEALVRDSIEDLGDPGHDINYGLGFIDIWKVLRHLDHVTTPPPATPIPSPPPISIPPVPDPVYKRFTSGIVATDNGVLLFSNHGHETEIKINNTIYKGRSSFLSPTTNHSNCSHEGPAFN